MGIIAALDRNGWGDRIGMFIALFGVSMPNFWVALMLVLFFSVRLGWLPPYGLGGIQYIAQGPGRGKPERSTEGEKIPDRPA